MQVTPLRMPTFLLEVRDASFFGALIFVVVQGAIGWWLWARDARSKVVVRRRRRRAVALFHTVASESFPDEASAERRRQEILSTWKSGAFQ